MNKVIELFLPALISSAVVATVVGLLLKKRTETIAAEVKNQFEQNMTVFRSNYLWKEKAVSELLGQVCMQFDRTARAFKRYHSTNLFLEASVLKDGNEKVRNLLLEKGYLIPGELIEDANKLIEHYDVWLEQFYQHRDAANPNLNQKFVFAGPQGFGFPHQSEANFKTKYRQLWDELYS